MMTERRMEICLVMAVGNYLIIIHRHAVLMDNFRAMTPSPFIEPYKDFDYFKTAKMDAVMSSTLPVPLTLRYTGAFTLSAAFAWAAQLE